MQFKKKYQVLAISNYMSLDYAPLNIDGVEIPEGSLFMIVNWDYATDGIYIVDIQGNLNSGPKLSRVVSMKQLFLEEAIIKVLGGTSNKGTCWCSRWSEDHGEYYIDLRPNYEWEEISEDSTTTLTNKQQTQESNSRRWFKVVDQSLPSFEKVGIAVKSEVYPNGLVWYEIAFDEESKGFFNTNELEEIPDWREI